MEYGPLGAARGDWQAALVASTIANANRPRKARAFKVKDFVLRWSEASRRKKQDPREMLAIFRALAAGRSNDVDAR